MSSRLLTMALSCTLFAASCAVPRAVGPTTTRPLLENAEGIKRELDDFGRRLYSALAQGQPEAVMLDELGVRALLLPSTVDRTLAMRSTALARCHLPPDERALFRSAVYAGICVQQGRLEPDGGALGLRAPGFAFERALLVAREPGGGALASWVEGHFVHTDAGFLVLTLERVEPPRRDHADLELAVCELRAGSYGHKRW